MKHPLTILTLIAAVTTSLLACKSQQKVTTLPEPQPIAGPIIGGSAAPIAAIPKAVIYRTNGEFNQCVPINIDPLTGQIISYPAPTDILGQQPIPLTDGYLLDRRGIGPNTRFTTYTYTQYAALPAAPTPEQLIGHIIPDAHITTLVVLPILATQAAADTAAVNSLIRRGLPDCDIKITPATPLEQ